MLNGRYPIDVIERGIPCSDAAAEVAAMGSAVKDFAIGDHVSVMFDLSNLTGFDDEPGRALGGDVDGVLGEYAIFEEKNIVQLPKQWLSIPGSYHRVCRRDSLDCARRPEGGEPEKRPLARFVSHVSSLPRQ
jgi:hypothetical protein